MDLGPLPTVTQGSISDKVYEILRERIFLNHFAPGERLRPAAIESQMVSRAPLQHALDRLAVEGLIEIVPRKRTYVTKPEENDIEEVFELRRILERMLRSWQSNR
jgi:DNA-binding GntR family transcriptional regulator